MIYSNSKEIKSVDPKLGQDQKTKELGCSISTIQRYRQNIVNLSPYKSPLTSNKRRQKTSSNLKRPQMTSKGPNPVVDSATDTVKPDKNENKLKKGGNTEIIDEPLVEIFHNNNNSLGWQYRPTAFLSSKRK